MFGLEYRRCILSHSTFITLLILFPSVAIIVFFIFATELRRFIRKVPEIQTHQHIEYFKHVVSHQMYAALLQIVLLGIPVVLFLLRAISRLLRFDDVWFMLIPSIIVLILGQSFKATEKKAKTLPVSDPQLKDERERIVKIWMRKPFPTW